ncbi:MAG: hypothetical protein ACE37H_01550 [Phycisphaeraceae bacterium]
MTPDPAPARTGRRPPRGAARRAFYLASWVLFIAWLSLGFSYETQKASWLCGWGWAIALVLWCREDAAIAGRPLPTMSLWIVLLFWPIALPVCVIRARGLVPGLALVLIHAFVYATAYGVAAAQASRAS